MLLELLPIFLISYLVPLLLYWFWRRGLYIYLLFVLSFGIYYGWWVNFGVPNEHDCRAGCAIAISAFLLVLTCLLLGGAFAALSTFIFKKFFYRRR